ncbi:unnamed protein product [Lactuca saligna]|uniref:Uncharacterized protein n=1 Tax=Lactuca saligna TaxID=75948 RepID=A0AA35VXT6_LACSI|nr:unnamed protein product [Lactuca saligna]
MASSASLLHYTTPPIRIPGDIDLNHYSLPFSSWNTIVVRKVWISGKNLPDIETLFTGLFLEDHHRQKTIQDVETLYRSVDLSRGDDEAMEWRRYRRRWMVAMTQSANLGDVD